MELVKDVLNRIPKNFINILIYSFIFGILCHGMIYFNIWPGHDNAPVYFMESKVSLLQGLGDTAAGGRFFQSIISMIFYGEANTPWLCGIVLMICCALAAWFTVDAFEIESAVWTIVLTALFITNPFVLSVNCYTGNTYVFSVCIFLSCFSFWCFINNKDAAYWILLFVAVNTYASYGGVVLAFFVVYELREIILDKNYNFSCGLKRHLKLVFTAGSAFVFSYGINIGLTKIFGVTAQSRVSDAIVDTNKGYKKAILTYADRLKNLYKQVFYFFKDYVKGAPLYELCVRICILVVLILFFAFIVKQAKYYRPLNVCLLVVDIICLPICMNVISTVWDSHSLMWFPFIALWIFIIAFCDRIDTIREEKNRLIEYIVFSSLVLCLISCVHWTKLAHNAYTKTWANYETGINLANRIVYRIEDIDGYVKGETPVLFIGDIRKNYSRDESVIAFDTLDMFAGVGSYYPTAFTYMYPFFTFIRQELCADMNIVNDKSSVMNNENLVMDLNSYGLNVTENDVMGLYDSLTCYPNKQCYTWYDGVLVFKVAEE